MALALKRRKFRQVTISDDGVSMCDGPDFRLFFPDEALAMVINHYDKTGEMEPFTLCLKLFRANDAEYDAEDDAEYDVDSYGARIDGRAYGRFKKSQSD